MWVMGRLEWLALELMMHAKNVAENSDSLEVREFWQTLEATLNCQRHETKLDIMWSPHKLEFNGENMESTAAGSNNRSDVMLLAWPPRAVRPTVIATVYHTTNVAENAASNRPGQMYPETRLLWRDRIVTGELPNLAMHQLAEALHVRREVNVSEDIPPTPEDLPDPSDDENSKEDRESECDIVDEWAPES